MADIKFTLFLPKMLRAGLFSVLLLLLLFTSSSNAQGLTGLGDTPWPTLGGNAAHSGRSRFLGPVHTPVVLWRRPLGICMGTNGGMSLAADGTIYISACNHLRAFDSHNGEILWTYPLHGFSTAVPTVGADGNIYWGFGNSAGVITPEGKTRWGVTGLNIFSGFHSSIALDAQGNVYFSHGPFWSFDLQGKLRWFAFPDSVFGDSSPVIGLDDTIYVQGGQGLTAFRTDGTTKWTLPIDTPGTDPVLGDDGTIYIGGQPGRLFAVNPDGKLKWTFEVDNPHQNRSVSKIPVLGADGKVHFPYQDSIYAVQSDGERAWKITPTRGGMEPIVADRDGRIYGCENGVTPARCFGIAPDGQIIWEYTLPTLWDDSEFGTTYPVIAADGLMYVLGFGYTNGLSITALVDSTVWPIPAASPATVDVSTEEGGETIYQSLAITSTTGSLEWTAAISPTVTTWLTIRETEGITPDELTLEISPDGLKPGGYSAKVILQGRGGLNDGVQIPVSLTITLPSKAPPQYSIYLPTVTQVGIPAIPAQLPNPGPYTIAFDRKNYSTTDLFSVDQAGQETRLTYRGGHGLDWSPDGSRIVYISHRDTFTEIYSMGIDGTSLTQLTHDQANIQYPVWSPDGNKILFLSDRAEKSHQYDLYVMNADGTVLRRLTNSGTLPYFGSGPVWSPDSHHIAFTQGGDTYVVNIENGSQSILADLPGDERVLDWSPSGNRLLIAAPYGTSVSADLYTIYTDGSGLAALTQTSLSETDAEWSPDGQWIAFTARSSPLEEDLFVMRADGTELKHLTYFPNYEVYPSWSPNSQWIVFSCGNYSSLDLCLIRPDGYGFQKIVSSSDREENPRWKPLTGSNR